MGSFKVAISFSCRQFASAYTGPHSTLALLIASQALADLLSSLLALLFLAWLQPTGQLLPNVPCLLLSPALALLAVVSLPTVLLTTLALLIPATLHTRGRLPLAFVPWALALTLGLIIILFLAFYNPLFGPSVTKRF